MLHVDDTNLDTRLDASMQLRKLETREIINSNARGT